MIDASLRALVLRDRQVMVGYIGFHTAPGAEYLQPYAPGGVEFGFTVYPPFLRQGYAREASIAVMSYMTEYPDAYHHPREDAMFARLAKRDSSLVARIAEIKRAHRTIGSAGKKLLAALQRLEGNPRVDEGGVISRMNDYVKALREHMSIEERDLFQRAREVLDEQDLEEIDHAFARVIDPLFEAAVEDAFAAYSPLVRYLVEQPVVRGALGALDTMYRSAETLGEILFGRPAEKSARSMLK